MPYIGGIYTGLKYQGASINDDAEVAELDGVIQKFVDTNTQDSIVSIFMMPSLFYTADTAPTFKAFAVYRPDTLNGYKPRNNKLYTYPYMFLTLDCVNDCKEYRYEFSSDEGVIHFVVFAGMSPNVEISCCPRDYNGSHEQAEGSNTTLNFTEQIVMTGFPQCAFTIDAYRAWLAQKSVSDLASVTTGALATAGAFATGNPILGYAGAVGVANTINNSLISMTKGSTSRGSQGGNNLTAMRAKDFYIKYMCVNKNYAKIIDDYFDRFGYAHHSVEVPNRASRPHWNYVKTQDCTITGSIPADDMKKICDIYDSGITFWRNPSEVGNYSLDNSPQEI